MATYRCISRYLMFAALAGLNRSPYVLIFHLSYCVRQGGYVFICVFCVSVCLLTGLLKKLLIKSI